MPAPQPCRMMRIHIGENDRYQGQPLHAEILRRCRQAGMVLVTVYRGIEGYGASTLIHRPGWWGRSQDAPIVITVVDTEEKMQALLPVLNGIVDEGLIAISTVEFFRFNTSEKDGTDVRH